MSRKRGGTREKKEERGKRKKRKVKGKKWKAEYKHSNKIHYSYWLTI